MIKSINKKSKDNHFVIIFNLFKFILVFLLLSSNYSNCIASETSLKDNVTLNIKNRSIKDVFTEIEKQTGYVFFYSAANLNVNKRVNIKVKNQSLNKVLDELLKGTDCVYSYSGRQILIKPKKEEPQIKTKPSKKHQTHRIVGTVVDDATNETLIGVSIRIKDTDKGIITDADGKFVLDGVATNSELEVSYVGYKTQLLATGDLATINIRMVSSNEQLGEVVVVGAGTQKKISVTGAISAIKGDALRAPSSSLTSNFAGKLAGVISMTHSGEPGSTSEFYIRGVSTFGGRATPLILLDDVEISAGDLNNIPAESIESFSILKDASATAIYGARGANGVMLVTTKSGHQNERTQIHVAVETSYLHPVKRPTFVDGATYMRMYNESQLSRSPKATPMYTQERIDNTQNHINPYVFPDVDWYSTCFNDYSTSQRANLNVQGGSSKVTYYMSLQINHDSGIFKKVSSNQLNTNVNKYKYIFQSNIDYRLTSTTQVGLRMNTQIQKNSGPNASTSDVFYQCYNLTPVLFPAYFPAQEGDKHIRFGGDFLAANSYYINPYAWMLNGREDSNSSTINTSVHINQDFGFITKGLSLTTLVNWKAYSYSSYTERYEPFRYRVVDGSWSADKPDEYQIEQVGGDGSDYITQSNNNPYRDNTFYLDARLNYSRRFGDHDVTGMLMYMMREFRDSGILPKRNQGFSGRFTYDYQNKYLAEFNFGYNGTERLASGHRFEFFPAMSLGWVVSSEDFWKPLSKVVNFFKLRGSYGLVGSDETGESAGAPHFLYRSSVTMHGTGNFMTGEDHDFIYSGPVINNYPVENAHWERAKKLDIGFDMNLFNDALNIVADFFHDKRDRILLKRGSWPTVLGYNDAIPWSNIGKVDNKGVELSVNWKKNVTRDFNFELRGTFTYTKNKYVYVDDPDYSYSWQMRTGKPLSYQVGYLADGLFADYDDISMSPVQNLGSVVMPGDIKYRDINGDGVITTEDQIMTSPYGSTPRIQYGFGLNVNYLHFDFGVFFNGSANRTLMINGITPFCSNPGYPGYHGDRNVFKFIADDYWSLDNPNPNAKYPRLGVLSSQVDNNMHNSSFWQRCGNFIRWKTLEIGYSFNYCRIYFSGDNLACWGPFKTWDPELWWNSYPLSRTFNLGVQFHF